MSGVFIKLKPIEFAESVFKVKEGVDLTLHNRPYLKPIYNSDFPRILLLGGRQIEKTTSQLVISLIDNIFIPGFKNLYITPLKEQAESISKVHFHDMIRSTPVLGESINPITSIMNKEFDNSSKYRFAYAQDSADRIRSQTADRIIYDEIQDMDGGIFPIINQTIKHSRFGKTIYSGTSKTELHATHFFWDNSTGYDWGVKCPHCNRWQFLTPKNIGENNPICSFCSKPIYSEDILNPKRSTWISTGSEKAKIKGFRVNQLMNPDVVKYWDRFLYDYEMTKKLSGDDGVLNEIFGYASGKGQAIFTEDMLKELSGWGTDEHYQRILDSPGGYKGKCYMGIDWGAEDAYTAVTVIGFPRSHTEMLMLHHEVFDDIRSMDPTIRKVVELIKFFRPELVAADAGMGFDKNSAILSVYPGLLKPIYYSGSYKGFIGYHKNSASFIVNRTRAISLVISDLKSKKLRPPVWGRWSKWVPHYLTVFKSVTGNTRSGSQRVVYMRKASQNDDLFQSLVFARLAYNIAMGNFLDYDIE